MSVRLCVRAYMRPGRVILSTGFLSSSSLVCNHSSLRANAVILSVKNGAAVAYKIRLFVFGSRHISAEVCTLCVPFALILLLCCCKLMYVTIPRVTLHAITFNRYAFCAAAMRPFVKLLQPLAVVIMWWSCCVC